MQGSLEISWWCTMQTRGTFWPCYASPDAHFFMLMTPRPNFVLVTAHDWGLPFGSYSPRDHAPASLSFPLSSVSITTSTTLRKPSISSSTVPPMPALAKLIELPTYTGLPVLRASSFESRVVKSSVLPWVNSGVLSVSFGEALCMLISHRPEVISKLRRTHVRHSIHK
jgi:hypothetical protein